MLLDNQNDSTYGEIFKDIKGYEGMYQVSNHGRVKSLKRKLVPADRMLKQRISNKGYPTISLSKKGKPSICSVHSLVIRTFVGERPNGLQVNHIDGIKTNNHVTNLEYCTNSENMQHALDMGLIKRGENNHNSKLTPIQVLEIREMYANGKASQYEIANLYNMSQTTIGEITRREIWKHI